MLVGREDIFPCGETRTLEATTAFCGKSRCLTHMAAVCSTPASFPLIFLTFAPSHLPQPSSLALSPAHFLPVVATIQFRSLFAFLLCCMPASPYLPPYLATSRPVSILFLPIFLCPPGSRHSLPLLASPPSTSMCTSHTPPCRSFSPCLPACLPPCIPLFLHAFQLASLASFLSLLPARVNMTHPD